MIDERLERAAIALSEGVNKSNIACAVGVTRDRLILVSHVEGEAS